MSILDQFLDKTLAIIDETISTIYYQNIDFYIINYPSGARTFSRDSTKNIPAVQGICEGFAERCSPAQEGMWLQMTNAAMSALLTHK